MIKYSTIQLVERSCGFWIWALGLIWVLTPFQEVTHQPWREQRRETRARLVHQGAETVSRADEQNLDDEQSRDEKVKNMIIIQG